MFNNKNIWAFSRVSFADFEWVNISWACEYILKQGRVCALMVFHLPGTSWRLGTKKGTLVVKKVYDT